MEEQFVDDERELSCQLGRQLELMEVVVEVAEDLEDELDREDVKTDATNAVTEDISLVIVVAEDVAGNFHHLCLSTGAKR